jgi:hypothetical protein
VALAVAEGRPFPIGSARNRSVTRSGSNSAAHRRYDRCSVCRVLPTIGVLIAFVGCSAHRASSPTSQQPVEEMPTAEECAAHMEPFENARWDTPLDCSEFHQAHALPSKVFEASQVDCDLREELRAYVASRRSCAVAEDCVVVPTECPFGCGISVARSEAVGIKQKVEALSSRYAAKHACAYQCFAMTGTTCRHGKCGDAHSQCLPKRAW